MQKLARLYTSLDPAKVGSWRRVDVDLQTGYKLQELYFYIKLSSYMIDLGKLRMSLAGSKEKLQQCNLFILGVFLQQSIKNVRNG